MQCWRVIYAISCHRNHVSIALQCTDDPKLVSSVHPRADEIVPALGFEDNSFCGRGEVLYRRSRGQYFDLIESRSSRLRGANRLCLLETETVTKLELRQSAPPNRADLNRQEHGSAAADFLSH